MGFFDFNFYQIKTFQKAGSELIFKCVGDCFFKCVGDCFFFKNQKIAR